MINYILSLIDWSTENWEFLVAIIALIFTTYTIYVNSRIKKQEIFHDLVKQESLLWDRIRGAMEQSVRVERLLNFYDYLALLYFKGVIDKNLTEEYFKSEFKRVCKKHKSSINHHFNHLIELRNLWK